MIPSREHFLLKRRNALSTFSFSPTFTVDILVFTTFATAFIDYSIIIAISKNDVKSFFGVFICFWGIFPFLFFRRKKYVYPCRTPSNYATGSKSLAGCLHHGQTKSAGNSSPSWTYPHTLHTHFFTPPFSSFATAGLGLMLL